MKKVIVSFVALLSASFMFIQNHGYAEEVQTVVQENVVVNTDSKLANIDISNLSVGESKTVVSHIDGKDISVSVKKIKNAPTGYSGFRGWHYSHSLGSGDGTYEVSYSVLGLVTMSFYVEVNRGMIWKAFDPYYHSLFGVNSAELVHDSSWQATYHLAFSMAVPVIGGPSWTVDVRAKIAGNNNLEVWFR